MGRPRKNPEEGEEMNVNKVTFENDCHVAKIGSRTYLRVPDTKQDIPYIPNENPMFKSKDEKTYDVFKSLEDYFSKLTDRYQDMLEVREIILKYMNSESEVSHDRLHPWQIPYSDFSQIDARIEAHKRGLQNFQNEFNVFYSLFFDITTPSDALTVSDSMWQELAKRNGWRPND